MVTLEFPDGTKKEFEKGISGKEIAQSIGPRLAQAALAIEVDGKVKDLSAKVDTDSRIRILTYEDKQGKEVFRHSAAHVLADAIMRVFPDAKLTIGPAVDDGFYYDIDKASPFTPEDMKKLEDQMAKVVSENLEFRRLEVAKEEAARRFASNPYKMEMINELGDEQCSVYEHGDFADLCRGPHVPSTGYIKAIKLTKIAGAYWRADAKNKQLQRVYGIAFPSKKELDEHLKLLEEAEKRDHRKLGKELELFSIHDEGPGFPFFLPKGMVSKNELMNYWREEHRKAGYVELQTPIMLSRHLWETSGHWFHYKEHMYTTHIDNDDFAIKPMNCPGGLLVYKEKVHSYRELPLKVGELGIVHRHELSGVLAGLFRVRCFTQDDAHVFMREDQVKKEVLEVIELMKKIYGLFGFSYHVELSTRPAKSIGTDEAWEKTTAWLKEALDDAGFKYKVNPGDGAFYGPKIDFHLKDAIGRTWQCGTIQLDMNLPERFDITYMDKEGTQDKRPIMIHRVIYGSLERFMGILIEHFAGKFPLWLSPVQVRILTVADRFEEYAQKISSELFDAGIRVEVDARSESIGKKVREAQLQKIPIMLTVGEKEMADGTVALRTLDGKVVFGMKPAELKEKLLENIREKRKTIEL